MKITYLINLCISSWTSTLEIGRNEIGEARVLESGDVRWIVIIIEASRVGNRITRYTLITLARCSRSPRGNRGVVTRDLGSGTGLCGSRRERGWFNDRLCAILAGNACTRSRCGSTCRHRISFRTVKSLRYSTHATILIRFFFLLIIILIKSLSSQVFEFEFLSSKI